MNAPRCLVAEDEPLLAQGLCAELAQVWPELEIAAVVGDGHAALARTLELRPEVCFFDIRMPGLSGLEVAQALAEDWPDADACAAAVPLPLLVFVTAYDAHALQAFEAQAVDYLVKPVQRARLADCVTRLRTRLARQPPPAGTGALPADALHQAMARLHDLLGAAAPAPPAARLAVIQAQVGALVHLVPVEEVIYFEAADKYVRVVTAEREHLIRTSLRELLPQLDAQVFWQVHRGTVVQARHIASARREESGKVTLTLKGRAERLTASRLYAHRFKGM